MSSVQTETEDSKFRQDREPLQNQLHEQGQTSYSTAILLLRKGLRRDEAVRAASMVIAILMWVAMGLWVGF